MIRHLRSRMLTVALVATVLGASVSAEDIRYIQVGQRYYWTGVFSDELVLVSAVDRVNNRVQVTRADGEVVWLDPTRLITREKANENTVGRVIIGGILAGAAISAATEPAEPTPRPPVVAAAGTTRAFSLCNRSTKGTLYSAVAYQSGGRWKTFGWYSLSQGACRQFTGVSGDRVLYFANDGTTWTWSGDIPTCVHPRDAFDLTYSKDCVAPYQSRGFVSRSLSGSNDTFDLID